VILRRLLLNNAGPFLSEWEVELPLGVTAVVAEYADAPSRSNRGGKSFFAVDAPLYALFGEFRGKTDDFVHRLAAGEEDGFVELEAENSEGTRFVLRRGRTRRGDPIRELDGAAVKEKELERIVAEEILGLSLEEYKLTTMFVQGEMHAFLKMTPAEKRRVVSPWFRTDRWVPRAELAKKRLAEAKRELRDLDVLEAEANEYLEETAGVEKQLDEVVEPTYRDARRALEAAQERRALALAELEKVRGDRAELARVRGEVERLEAAVVEERDEADAELEAAEAELEEAKGNLVAATGRKAEVERLEREIASIEDLRTAVVEVQTKLTEDEAAGRRARRAREELLVRYNELVRSRTGTCPVLQEPCDRVGRDEAVLAEMKKEGLGHRRAADRLRKSVEELGWKLDMSKADLATAEESRAALEEIRAQPTVPQAQDAYERAKRRADDAASARSRIKLARTETTRALSRARTAEKRLASREDSTVEEEVAAAAEALSLAESALGDVEQERAEYLACRGRRDEMRSRLEDLGERRAAARGRVENLAWAAYAFGATGIPSRELENAFGVAEDAMNRVLSDLGAPTQLRFSPARELKDWEPGCLACGFVYPKGERKHVCHECGVPRRKRRRDELRLEVLDGEYESAFELDSGGGQVLLSLGTRLGLATLPGASRRVRCEHAVIDEPDGALDPPNRTALHRLLAGRLPDLGIRQALLITHADVREEFDSVVVVRRWADEDRSGVWSD
jgi:DNA repair exonuclease SbcCD ATPase subunit